MSVNRGRLTQNHRPYRSALLNRKYYGCQLDFYRKLNRTVEIVLAITTPSTIGGWAIWHGETGQAIWAAIAAVLALVVALKPVFDWPKEIDRYSRLHAEHTVQYYVLKQLVEDIEMEKTITPEMEKRFLDARDRHAQLSKDDDVRPNRRVASQCEREVLQEIPSVKLWIPTDGETE